MAGKAEKTEDVINYKKTLSTMFASGAILCFGALSLLNNFSMDYYSVMFMLSIVVPASLCVGFTGYVIGFFLDTRGEIKIGRKNKKQNAQPQDPYKIESMFAPTTTENNEESAQ